MTFNPCIDVHTSVSKIKPDIKLSCAEPLVQPGGGDINVARAILRLSMGCSFEEAVEYGVACGTAATLQPGTSLCSRNDVVSILSGMRDLNTAAYSY